MAFGRGRENEQDTLASPSAGASAAPSRSTASPGGLTAFIDQGSEFEGKLSFRDTVRIDGRFQGQISSENTLIVGESGEIQAEIQSKTVAVSGTVVGDIHAQQKVVLHKTAKVTGNIEAPSLVIEEGATVNGEIKMTGAGTASKPPRLEAVSGSKGQPPSEES